MFICFVSIVVNPGSPLLRLWQANTYLKHYIESYLPRRSTKRNWNIVYQFNIHKAFQLWIPTTIARIIWVSCRNKTSFSNIADVYTSLYASTMKNDFYLAQFLIITTTNFLTSRHIIRIKSESKSRQLDYKVRRKSDQFILSGASQFSRKRKYSTERYVNNYNN